MAKKDQVIQNDSNNKDEGETTQRKGKKKNFVIIYSATLSFVFSLGFLFVRPFMCFLFWQNFHVEWQ